MHTGITRKRYSAMSIDPVIQKTQFGVTFLTFWVGVKDFGKMQQSQSLKKYFRTFLKRQVR